MDDCLADSIFVKCILSIRDCIICVCMYIFVPTDVGFTIIESTVQSLTSSLFSIELTLICEFK